MRTPSRIAVALLLLGSVPAVARADQCTGAKPPAAFDRATAMEAIFCHYDRDHQGTLLPVEHTASWEMSEADTLASPILAMVYREGGVQRGVLVVQRQMIVDGEVAIGHAQTAVISIYVFRQTGGRWLLEKGEDEALDEGHDGRAPDAQLVKLGPDRFGIWFSSGDIHQGYTHSSALVVALSETRIREVGRFDLGASNSGACSDDPKERGGGIYACWSYEGEPAFIAAAGAEYYTLRITYTGTEWIEPNSNRVRKKNLALCLTRGAGAYNETTDPKCASHTALPGRDVFMGDGATGKRRRR